MKIENSQRVIEEKVRPILAAHGGDIQIISLEDGILKVRFTGSCAGCAAADLTMEEVVKKEVLEAVPEVKDVILDTSVSEELMDFAKKILRGTERGK
jgi:Fe-S cluster biogenesis protein NfuA